MLRRLPAWRGKPLIASARHRHEPTTQSFFPLGPPTAHLSDEKLYHGGKSSTDPLRILFCGSDTFSCASLRALYAEHVRNKRLIESLDVMVLPPQKVGRGLKELREVPCKSLADELHLSVHQRPTFRDWELPNGTNLIVVVSFGLFVPKRILSSAKYGGINVHPSLLPDLRGPAPIHHAILRGDEHTGVSLQTLDDAAFDHGTVLAQTPAPGIPITSGASLTQITESLAEAGASMLVEGLRKGLHLHPHNDAGWMQSHLAEGELTHAPKVHKSQAEVDWTSWSADVWMRRIRVFGSVWTYGRLVSAKPGGKRIIFLDAKMVSPAEKEGHRRPGLLWTTDASWQKSAAQKIQKLDEGADAVDIRTVDGSWIRVGRVKVDGKAEQSAASGLKAFVAESEGS